MAAAILLAVTVKLKRRSSAAEARADRNILFNKNSVKFIQSVTRLGKQFQRQPADSPTETFLWC